VRPTWLFFHYAYAVFHSPAYRERYAEFLRADFPRLPLTSNFELFRSLAGFGGELVDLHARGKGEPQGINFPVKGDNVIEEVRYEPASPGVRPSSGAAIAKDRNAPANPGVSAAGGVAASGTDALHPGRVWINDK